MMMMGTWQLLCLNVHAYFWVIFIIFKIAETYVLFHNHISNIFYKIYLSLQSKIIVKLC